MHPQVRRRLELALFGRSKDVPSGPYYAWVYSFPSKDNPVVYVTNGEMYAALEYSLISGAKIKEWQHLLASDRARFSKTKSNIDSFASLDDALERANELQASMFDLTPKQLQHILRSGVSI